MQRYFTQLSFNGTSYHGWQVQPNALTVQESLEKAFSAILGEKVTVTGAGRTDTGVHATFFILHFDSEKHDLDTGRLVYRLNRFLPPAIAIQRIWKVPEKAHARFSAISRTYQFFIARQKDPFATETSLLYTGHLEVEKMNEAAALLFDYTDFTSFSRLHTDVKTNYCQIHKAFWSEVPGKLVFTIKANRFLRNMVRAIVGTLVVVGRGKMTIDEFREVIERKDRSAAGPSAPARGLFLTGIEYPDSLW